MVGEPRRRDVDDPRGVERAAGGAVDGRLMEGAGDEDPAHVLRDRPTGCRRRRRNRRRAGRRDRPSDTGRPPPADRRRPRRSRASRARGRCRGQRRRHGLDRQQQQEHVAGALTPGLVGHHGRPRARHPFDRTVGIRARTHGHQAGDGTEGHQRGRRRRQPGGPPHQRRPADSTPTMIRATTKCTICGWSAARLGMAASPGPVRIPEKKKGPMHLASGLPLIYPRQRPTLPRTYARSTIGGSRLNFRVRNGNGCDPAPMATGKLGVWGSASARDASCGATGPISAGDASNRSSQIISVKSSEYPAIDRSLTTHPQRASEYGQASRLISIGQLNVSLRFHTRPINLVVYQEPSGTYVQGNLILWRVSRLDAFSVSPFRT